MEPNLAKRVKAAAGAAWWTLLFTWVLGALAWTAGRVAMGGCMPCTARLWPPGVTWETLLPYTLWLFTAYKLFTWILFAGAVFLSIWARRLRKAGL